MDSSGAPEVPSLLDERTLTGLHEEFASTGDLPELATLIRGFVARGEGTVADIAAAASRGDLSPVQAGAHKLRGGSRTLGASLIAAVAEKLEAAGAAGDAEAVGCGVAELEVAFSLSRDALCEVVDAIDGGGRSAAPPDAGDDRRLRALLVGGEPVALGVLRAGIERLGHEAAVATGGEEARDALDRVRPHLLVVDLDLPGGYGLELARRARAGTGAGPYVVVASASGRVPQGDVGAVVDAALTKPGREDELRALLARAGDRAAQA